MVRASKAVLWAVVLPVGVGLIAAAAGATDPYLSPSDLPVPPRQASLAGIGVLVAGVGLNVLLETVIWRRMGRRAGFRPEGLVELGDPSKGSRSLPPDLMATVRGRPVRAWTYQTDDEDRSTTHTVVETDLRTPVEWHAAFVPADAPLEETPETGEGTVIVDDEFAVWGGVPEATARDVLSAHAADVLRDLGTNVLVGRPGQRALNETTDAIAAETDGAAGALVDGRASLAGADESVGAAERVRVDRPGLVLDAAELEARAEAVTVVADAVDRAVER